MTTYNVYMKYLYTLLLMVLSLVCKAQIFPYRSFPPICLSASEQSNCMYFDKTGVMWIGTDNGVKSFDGYQTRLYKSDAFSPNILPNNTIRSITEDHEDNLWLGTRNGLVRMNKRTGIFRTFSLPKENQRIIYMLYTSKLGTVWIGTDGGLSYFDPKTESFYTYDKTNSWLIDTDGRKRRMMDCSVKSVVEDRNGDMLVGTWSSGLFRFSRKQHTFRRYPPLNALNSAYSLFFDTKHRLWVGTWGYGVLRIDHPENMKQLQIHRYPYTTNHFDTYYRFVEDPVSGKLWACTREGVCYLDMKDELAEWNCYTALNGNSLNFSNDIATDGTGNIWICTQNSGVQQVNTHSSPFKVWQLDTHANPTINFTYSIMTGDGTWFWIGLNPYGLALYNRETGSTLYNQQIPGFGALDKKLFTTSISSIAQRCNGETWFAVNNYGVIVKPAGKPASLLHRRNTTYLKDDFVNTVFELRDKTMCIGQRGGLSLVYPDNKGVYLHMKQGKSDFTSCDIRHIMQDRQGNLWLSTDNEGIIRIAGNLHDVKSLKYKQYSPKQGNFAIDDATACLEDAKGRLWAISNSGGLFLYNREKDCFVPKNREYNLPGNRFLAIQKDRWDNLWLTTDEALVRIVWNGNETEPENVTTFTKEDGLGDIQFSANTACSWGNELIFGSRTSFFSFVPTVDMGKNFKRQNTLIVTDIRIDDESFAQLDSTERARVSKEMPAYTREIRIPASVRKFGVEFSLLTYGNAHKNQYAYRLEDYDNEWQYCSGDVHQASFQNLPSGTYHLYLKATDSYGHWQEMPYTITVKVLPPWYASRLAFMVYILLLIVGCFATVRWYKEYLKTKNRLQMGVILTNVTHELLTPLTVISATIYKLKSAAPQFADDYAVMESNVNRTTRLLRQILEVRKSQAGQLKLRVSRGDLSDFVQSACENIRPMATHRQVTLSLDIQRCEGVWFDRDKLDKILYNLLSNAIKYNRPEGGQVNVSLVCSKEEAVLTVADNGIGMSKDKQKHLYTRFFDGDYRKQNMPGTGIGLALTHDLVKLHHGSIRCKSTEGQGTTFTVSLPLRKTAYSATEIDLSENGKAIDRESVKLLTEEGTCETNRHAVFVRSNVSKILVVEDNEELLQLLLQALSKNYQVLTAKNGQQALNLIMKEQLDLVISDVMMPVMDGIELTRRIKSDKGFWQLPVILLTAKNQEEDKTEGYSIGADAYITKPFKFEELEVRIDSLITNREKIREKIIDVQRETTAREAEAKAQTRHYSDPDQAFVAKATAVVREHLSDPDYDRDTFARDMAMGASSLYNKVKATTGLTVVSFVNGIRLNEAKRILEEEPDILVTDLAIRVGFNTPKYFSKCFKKEFGMYPREYVEQLREG